MAIDRELPSNFRFRPIPVGDWIDMEFILQEVEQEIRGQVMAAGLEAMAKVHQNIAEGATNIANIIRGAKSGGQKKGG